MISRRKKGKGKVYIGVDNGVTGSIGKIYADGSVAK